MPVENGQQGPIGGAFKRTDKATLRSGKPFPLQALCNEMRYTGNHKECRYKKMSKFIHG
jgi:hypothetical protein